MNAEPVFRYRLTFAKTEAMRFTGHLDVYRTLERTLRRSQLPLAFTQGFSPHPRYALAAPLPHGCTSECEMADLWLEQAVGPEVVLARLRVVTPPGLRFDHAAAVPAGEPGLQSLVLAASYDAVLQQDLAADELRRRVAELLEGNHKVMQRRGKDYDLRPLIEGLELELLQDGRQVLRLRLAARPGATGRPDEVLRALCLDPAESLIMRTGLHGPSLTRPST